MSLLLMTPLGQPPVTVDNAPPPGTWCSEHHNRPAMLVEWVGPSDVPVSPTAWCESCLHFLQVTLQAVSL